MDFPRPIRSASAEKISILRVGKRGIRRSAGGCPRSFANCLKRKNLFDLSGLHPL